MEEVRQFYFTMAAYCGGEFKEQTFMKQFDRMDKNKDGKVDMQELY